MVRTTSAAIVHIIEPVVFSIVKSGAKVITIEPAILLFKQFTVLLFNKSSQRKMLFVWRKLLSFSARRLSRASAL
jgi:hypothetical protein